MYRLRVQNEKYAVDAYVLNDPCNHLILPSYPFCDPEQSRFTMAEAHVAIDIIGSRHPRSTFILEPIPVCVRPSDQPLLDTPPTRPLG